MNDRPCGSRSTHGQLVLIFLPSIDNRRHRWSLHGSCLGTARPRESMSPRGRPQLRLFSFGCQRFCLAALLGRPVHTSQFHYHAGRYYSESRMISHCTRLGMSRPSFRLSITISIILTRRLNSVIRAQNTLGRSLSDLITWSRMQSLFVQILDLRTRSIWCRIYYYVRPSLALNRPTNTDRPGP